MTCRATGGIEGRGGGRSGRGRIFVGAARRRGARPDPKQEAEHATLQSAAPASVRERRSLGSACLLSCSPGFAELGFPQASCSCLGTRLFWMPEEGKATGHLTIDDWIQKQKNKPGEASRGEVERFSQASGGARRDWTSNHNLQQPSTRTTQHTHNQKEHNEKITMHLLNSHPRPGLPPHFALRPARVPAAGPNTSADATAADPAPSALAWAASMPSSLLIVDRSSWILPLPWPRRA